MELVKQMYEEMVEISEPVELRNWIIDTINHYNMKMIQTNEDKKILAYLHSKLEGLV